LQILFAEHDHATVAVDAERVVHGHEEVDVAIALVAPLVLVVEVHGTLLSFPRDWGVDPMTSATRQIRTPGLRATPDGSGSRRGISKGVPARDAASVAQARRRDLGAGAPVPRPDPRNPADSRAPGGQQPTRATPRSRSSTSNPRARAAPPRPNGEPFGITRFTAVAATSLDRGVGLARPARTARRRSAGPGRRY